MGVQSRRRSRCNRTALRVCLVLSSLITACLAVHADDLKPGKQEIRSLISQLGDSNPAKRDEARDRLWDIGEEAYRELKEFRDSPDPELEIGVRMLLFRLEPFYGPWPAAMQTGRRFMRAGEYAKALKCLLSAARRHEPLRKDKWFRHLASTCWSKIGESRREGFELADWGLFVTGQFVRLVDMHPRSEYRQQCLYHLGRFEDMLREFPSGELAPLAKYSVLSGHPYNEPQAYLEMTDPGKEIREWPEFIAKNPGHPSLDDAAYRLARAYEVAGRRIEAVKWLDESRRLPDGEYKWKAAMRILYVLDALCTPDELERISRESASPEIADWASVSLAVALFRSGSFEKSLAAFRGYLASRPGGSCVKEALLRAELIEKRILPLLPKLADPAEGDKALYEMGRIFYHDVNANYNPAWKDQRTAYMSREINLLGRTHAFDNPAYFDSHNNYISAAAWFEMLLSAYPASALKDKTLYSLGSCWLKAPMLNRYSEHSRSPSEMLGKAKEYYSRVGQECPDSPLCETAARIIKVIDSFPPDWMEY